VTTAAAITTPTPLRVGDTGVFTKPGNTLEAVQAILAEARAWGMLGIDLEWNEEGRITWVGLGHAMGGTGRAVSFWWPTLPAEARRLIAEAFADPTLPKLGQNGIQADRPVWEREVGPTGGVWEDTMLMHHAAFPGIAHDLQQLVAQFLVVPPWKAWRREAMRQADQQRREQAKADKKAARVAGHEARNAARAAEKQARLEAKKAGQAQKVAAKEAAKSEKQLAHEAKIAAQIAERERKKAEKMAAHEERNRLAALNGKKGRKKGAAPAPVVGSPAAGVVVPMAAEPAAPTPSRADDEFPFETLPENGLLCSVCGEPQRMSPTGETCSNGHVGAPGEEPPPLVMETPEEMGGQDQQPPVPADVCPHNKIREGCDVCMGRGIWEGVTEVAPADAAAAMASEPDEPESEAPPAPPVAAEPPRTLLRPPVRPVGGIVFGGRAASLPPPVGAPRRQLKVIIADTDGTEREVALDPEES
jgi:hypothetical protein